MKAMIIEMAKKNIDGFVLAHNHPIGATSPSKEDYKFTKDVCHVSKIMSCMFYDHIIVGPNTDAVNNDWRNYSNMNEYIIKCYTEI
jgi:DNA repair protein RadC